MTARAMKVENYDRQLNGKTHDSQNNTQSHCRRKMLKTRFNYTLMRYNKPTA
jgi:hypothetical protein